MITRSETRAEGHGIRGHDIVFHLADPAQLPPRTVNLTFVAKAPGVSPIRVEITESGTADKALSGTVGSGVVRVR
ncbi:MAG: hypothetical protein HC938_08335 [Nitrospira sp.]|nr:hypothetical protein [Nitrospira sp.]